MRKFFHAAITTFLILVTFVSCDWISKDDYASVSFSKETKALQVTTNASEVLVDNYIWYYKAEKTDGGPNSGATANWTRVNPNSLGLSGILSGFSVGSWTFKLYKTQSTDVPESSVSETATVNTTLVSGKVNNISVDIDLDSISGNGSLQFKDIVVPENDGYGTWTYKIDDADAVSIALDSNNKLNKTISISSGTKTVQFTGTYTGSVIGSSITATVYSGVTTIISGSIDNLTVRYSLTYNANTTASYEGTLPTTSSFNSGSTVTVTSNVLTRTGYSLTGWNTKPDGSGSTYTAGQTFTITENTTLYAIWTFSGTIPAATGSGSVTNRDNVEWVQLWFEDDGNGGNKAPKWATVNIGATISDYSIVTTTVTTANKKEVYSTENVGGLYGWGSTNNYRTREAAQPVYVSDGYDLSGSKDMATNLWGPNWKMPSKAQLNKLSNHSDDGTTTYTGDDAFTTWIYCDGVNTQYVPGCTLAGYKISGKGSFSDKSIFLPYAGFNSNRAVSQQGKVGLYWTLTHEVQYGAWAFDCKKVTIYERVGHAFSVRALYVGSSDKEYTLTYNANATSYTGTVPAEQNYDNGEKLTVSSTELTRSGYVHTGWNTSADGNGYTYSFGHEFNIADDMTLYAVWKKACTVTYSANTEGSWSGELPQSQIVGSGTSITISSNELSMAGYTLKGWNTQSDWQGTKYLAGDTIKVTSNLTLYAMWAVTGEKFTVSFDNNTGDGPTVGSIVVDAGDETTLPSESSTTKSSLNSTKGYALAGWNTKADGSGVAYPPNATFIPNTNITLYAQWQSWVQLWFEDDGNGGNKAPKWAEFNVGASIKSYENVTEYVKSTIGVYYNFGGSSEFSTDYYYKTGKDNIQGTEYDTAVKLWGKNWQMPTEANYTSLLSSTNCTWQWCDGVEHTEENDGHMQYEAGCTLKGWKVSGKEEPYSSNSIFLPLAGSYRGSTSPYNIGTNGFYWSSQNSILVLQSNSHSVGGGTNNGYSRSIRGILK